MNSDIKKIFTPEKGTFRIISLYVGQGESTLLIIPYGEAHKYVLVDTNKDQKNEGIDVGKLLKDVLEDKLEAFINTHPHKDHLQGIRDIEDIVNEIWHSGHTPGKDNKEAYDEMVEVIKKIGKENEFILFGTNDENKIRKSDKETEIIKKIGDVDFIILSPAEYVADEIDDETAEERRKRIHEHCAVIKFVYKDKSILLTGDADKTAWKEHITDYHKEKLPSNVLSAVHHGSRTFFKDTEDDENVYEDHIKEIAPEALIISAPTQDESPHDHPHDDALELYKKHIPEENIYHLGESRECVIIDIDNEGNLSIETDEEIAKEYKIEQDADKEDSSDNKSAYNDRTFGGVKTETRKREYSPYSKPYYGN